MEGKREGAVEKDSIYIYEAAVMTPTIPREQLAAILNNASTEVMK